MTTSLRRALAAATATAAVLALAGCGGDDSGNAKASDEGSSSSSASSEPTSDSSDSSDGPADGEQLSGADFAALLQTALDQATTTHVTMDLGDAIGSGEGDADYTKTPPELSMKLSMDALGGEVEVRLVDGKLYMKSPAFGDKWISTALDDPNSPLGALGGSLDVKKQFEVFAAAVTSATNDGSEEVDGESLDHYTATVDTAKLLQGLPSAAAGQADLPDTMTQEWWFDSDGMIRQFTSDFAGAKTTMKLSDWGTDVDIEAPPASEVTDMNGARG